MDRRTPEAIYRLLVEDCGMLPGINLLIAGRITIRILIYSMGFSRRLAQHVHKQISLLIDQQIIELIRGNTPVIEIASRFGYSRSNIYNIIGRLGLSAPRSQRQSSEIEIAVGSRNENSNDLNNFQEEPERAEDPELEVPYEPETVPESLLTAPAEKETFEYEAVIQYQKHPKLTEIPDAELKLAIQTCYQSNFKVPQPLLFCGQQKSLGSDGQFDPEEFDRFFKRESRTKFLRHQPEKHTIKEKRAIFPGLRANGLASS